MSTNAESSDALTALEAALKGWATFRELEPLLARCRSEQAARERGWVTQFDIMRQTAERAETALQQRAALESESVELRAAFVAIRAVVERAEKAEAERDSLRAALDAKAEPPRAGLSDSAVVDDPGAFDAR